jgi:hypothetical protein
MTIKKIEQWHQKARPNPDAKAFNIQLGCHAEEFVEMLELLDAADHDDAMTIHLAELAVKALSRRLKMGRLAVVVADRKEFLDSLADQVVTAIGVGHCAGMQTAEACERVNDSNWSKFVDGEPVFNEAGKIAKGPDYAELNLEGLY